MKHVVQTLRFLKGGREGGRREGRKEGGRREGGGGREGRREGGGREEEGGRREGGREGASENRIWRYFSTDPNPCGHNLACMSATPL